MTTSLADQLKRYSKPQTTNLERGKSRPSLLFDPKEAAGLNKEDFYKIGVRGLEELITRDEVFEQFSRTLFSVESKNFERSVELCSTNTELDKEIKKFLQLLSPYVLLNCSCTALEWMIYRYSIHQYNREALLMLVLPYHENRIFQNIVCLMKFEEVNDPWAFLKPYQKIALTNLHLRNHASSNPYFINCVSNFMLDIIKINQKPDILTVAYNFFSKVFIGALEYSKGTPESLITQMFPALLKGLNSPIIDFRAASYVVAARLVTKCMLSNVVLDKLMEKIANGDGSHLSSEKVLLCVILYQSQLHYKNIPEVALMEIIRHQWFPKILQELNSAGSYIYPFLEVLVLKVVENVLEGKDEYYRSFLIDLLDEINIDENNYANIFNAIIDSVPLEQKEQEVKTWIAKAITKMEEQYPAQFDQHVYKILILTENKDRRCRLKKIMKGITTHQKKFQIFDKLYDSNAVIRMEAIKFISTNFRDLRSEEKDMLQISLEHRLVDDNYAVVKEALGIIDKTKIIAGARLTKILCDLLHRCYQDKQCWGKVLAKLLKLLCVSDNSNDFNVITTVFPLLLPKTSEEIAIAKLIINSDFFVNCPLFKTFNSNTELSIAGEFPNELFECLKTDRNTEIISSLYGETKFETIESFSPVQKYSLALLMSRIVDSNTPLDKLATCLEIIGKIPIADCSKSTKTECSILESLKIAKKGNLPLNSYLKCILDIVVCFGKANLSKLDFSSESPLSRFLLASSSFFYQDSDVHQCFFSKFNEALFINTDVTVDFMLHLTVYKKSCSLTQNVILNILSKEIHHGVDFGFFDLKNKYIPYILILLMSPDEEIREKSYQIVDIMMKYQRDDDSFYPLFEYIVKHRKEIILDFNQLPIILCNALNSKVNISNSILNTLVEFCTNIENPLYLAAASLKVISNVNTIPILENVSIFAKSILDKDRELFTEPESEIIHHCIKRFDGSIAENLKTGLNGFKFLVSALKNDRDCLNIDGERLSPSSITMKELNEEFFSSLSKETEPVLLDCIIEASVSPKNPNILLASNKIFKRINLNVNFVIPQLKDMEEVQSTSQSVNKKRKRPSVAQIPTVDILDTLEWKKGVRILELMQSKKKMTNLKFLIPKLFGILGKCLNFEEQGVVEYPKQLILSLILVCCEKLESVKLSENSFDVELVVQCIRASTNPQTHHHALLVLAHCASLFPTQVLHHIMAIFTFMGSSVLRHDDNYSFQLISRIIDSVIPILVEDGGIETITSVLRVFVDAILDIPEHRRLKLYSQLLEKIDVEKHLHLFLQLVFVAHVLYGSEEHNVKYKFEEHSTIKRLNMAVEIVMHFPPIIGFNSCEKLIHNLRRLPDVSDNLNKNSSEIDITDLTEKQFRNYKYTVLIFINNLISTKEFIAKIAVLSDNALESLEPFYKNIIVEILSYIQKNHRLLDENKNSHYWKAVQNLSLEILDHINALLTPEMFLLVVKGLMSHDLLSIRKRSLDLLNSKLNSELFISECGIKDLHSTADSLVAIIGKLNDDTSEDDMIVIQKALISLKLIVKTVGSENEDKYIEILAFITELVKTKQSHDYVLSSLILCLVELCVVLGVRAVNCLPTFMPILLKILTLEKNKDSPTLLFVTLLTAIEKIFKIFNVFMSPYLMKILYVLSQINYKWSDSSDPKLLPLKSIKTELSRNTPIRTLIQAVDETFSYTVEKKKFGSIGPVMDILKTNLGYVSSRDVEQHMPQLKEFFMNALEFRNLELCSFDQINAIENYIVEAFCALALKLSDSAFGYFFNRIFIWSVEEKNNNRISTFYNLTYHLSKSLKRLFGLFAGIFIDNAAKILEASNKKTFLFQNKKENVFLLEKVLQTLALVFEHSTRKFITKDRFEILMSPIVDNLENNMNGMADLESRTNELVIPCIVHFTVATADDSLWKQLNYQILLKMRNSNYKIRLISLRCLTEIVKKLGEDFLPLLPETIPFLSELLEDDHEIVQEHCKISIQELEQVLGENLTKYF